MKNLFTIAILVILTFVFAGCPIINNPEYKEGVFPKVPVNFAEVNSEYDDYNSALPIIHYSPYLFFSSNRNSQGEKFDVVGDNLNIWWDMETGLLTINNSISYYDMRFADTLLSMINTTDNEFGPYSLNYGINYNNSNYTLINLVTYSSNYESNNYQSKYVYYKSDGSGIDGTYYGPFNISMVDSTYDLQYISFFSEETDDINQWDVSPSNFEQMIFNSSTPGNTGIYSVNLPENDDFIEMLKKDTIINPVIITELNSSSEDKCPYVNAHLMVFTSNREGGFGGYDLYYSWYENGIWSSPVNFGEDINTEYDEFRPVTIAVDRFINDLMIFSSNRPGGKGGFDLYYVGLPFKLRDLVYLEN
jgi:hypothetical protein